MNHGQCKYVSFREIKGVTFVLGLTPPHNFLNIFRNLPTMTEA